MEGVLMSDTPAPEASQIVHAPAVTAAGPSRRGKYSNLDWDGHKMQLQALYLTQGKSLAETMRTMKEDYSFEATQRVYKDKFKQWGWQKNLPAKHAQFMVYKASDRKRKERKETVFMYGGQDWDHKRAKHTLSRTKKAGDDGDVINMKTPASIAYKTPNNLIQTPSNLIPTPQFNDESEGSDSGTVELVRYVSEDDDEQPGPYQQGQPLLLRWQGHSRTDLDNMWQRGQRLVEQGQLSQAEELILSASTGMCRVLGETHEDTNKVAYYLADLYVRLGRSDEADSMLEDVTKKHIDTLGYEHKKTQQHIMHCVELLNAWNRSIDALAFLTRAEEMLQLQQKDQRRGRKKESNSKHKGTLRTEPKFTAASEHLPLPEIDDDDSSQINHYLDRARSRVQLGDQATEAFLLEIIRQCEKYHPGLHIQHLRARSELLKLYVITDTVDDNLIAFNAAEVACIEALGDYEWEEDKFESIEVIEMALQLTSDILKGNAKLAASLFRRISDIATNLFGETDERIIWILITIGTVYQNFEGWEDAEEWFEQAFSGALQGFDHKDGIVLSLQRAIDKRHFSYISDEGRPFKTIFGISGVTIRPGRLHLD